MSASTPASGGPLALDDPGLIRALRGVLREAGFHGEGVRSVLGAESALLSRPGDMPLHERRLAGVEPLGTLIKLLVLDAPVLEDAARAAFRPLRLDDVRSLGVVAGAGEVRALVRIVPHDDVLIASDRRLGPRASAHPDHVAGVHGPSLTLSHLTVRRRVETMLDVGTGSGIQAILASRHAGRVVATDLNERALGFAAFNAILNGVENIEVRAGSFFEPVAGERFGLVTCNPPYVISPESAFLFRDSGLDGDAVSRDVVRALPRHLEEGAFGHVLVSWVVPPAAEWSVPLREWVAGSGCDAWLLHHGTRDPLTHASDWLRHDLAGDPAAFAAALDRWLAYFEELGIERIATGAVILRRRSGVNWVRADRMPVDELRPAGGQILRVFAAGDLLSALRDERELLHERLARAPQAVLEQRVVFRDGEWASGGAVLRLEEGLGFEAALDAGTAGMLAALDGRRTLGEVVGDLARLEGASREGIERAALSIVAELLAAGFLEVSRKASPAP